MNIHVPFESQGFVELLSDIPLPKWSASKWKGENHEFTYHSFSWEFKGAQYTFFLKKLAHHGVFAWFFRVDHSTFDFAPGSDDDTDHDEFYESMFGPPPHRNRYRDPDDEVVNGWSSDELVYEPNGRRGNHSSSSSDVDD
jgi:hypothetical protein